MSSLAIFGLSPVNDTFPVTVPPLSMSGVAVPPAAPPAAGAVASVFAVSAGLSPPQLTSANDPASIAPIQIFLIFFFEPPSSKN